MSIDVTKIVIAISISLVVCVAIVCITLIILQRGRNARDKDVKRSEIELAKSFAKNDEDFSYRTGNIQARRDNGRTSLSYRNDNNSAIVKAITGVICNVVNRLRKKTGGKG